MRIHSSVRYKQIIYQDLHTVIIHYGISLRCFREF